MPPPLPPRTDALHHARAQQHAQPLPLALLHQVLEDVRGWRAHDGADLHRVRDEGVHVGTSSLEAEHTFLRASVLVCVSRTQLHPSTTPGSRSHDLACHASQHRPEDAAPPRQADTLALRTHHDGAAFPLCILLLHIHCDSVHVQHAGPGAAAPAGTAVGRRLAGGGGGARRRPRFCRLATTWGWARRGRGVGWGGVEGWGWGEVGAEWLG